MNAHPGCRFTGVNTAEGCDGPIFLAEQKRGFRVAAFRVAGHCGAIENLDSGSTVLGMPGSGGLGSHISLILSRGVFAGWSILFQFHYMMVNDWLQPAGVVSFATP